MHRRLVFLLTVTLVGGGVGAEEIQHGQSDWSGGSGPLGPVPAWNNAFFDSVGVSWRAIPGQVCLESVPLQIAQAHPITVESLGAIKVVADDLDDDGDTDVISASYYGDRVTIHWNLGGGSSWQDQVLDETFRHPVGLTTADVDGDGLTDVLATATELNEVTWWRQLGGSPTAWERHSLPSPYPAGHDVVADDLDDDGDLDLVVPFFDDDAIVTWINDGRNPASFQRRTIIQNFDYPTKIAVCDIDNDGDLDLASVAWHDAALAWWRNDGGHEISWSRHDIAGRLQGVHWVSCADMDDDGHNDLLTASMNLGEITWWRNLGGDDVSWERRAVTTELAGAVSVEVADIDGDGDLDVAGSGWTPTGGVSWWQNLGGAGSWTRHEIAPAFGESSSVHLTDVDGDGALDVLASSWSLNRVSWWTTGSFIEEGWLMSSILDTETTADWLSWDLTPIDPSSIDVVVTARSGDDPSDMGRWRQLEDTDLSILASDGARYLQYQIELHRRSTGASPIVRDIFFRWSAPRQRMVRHPKKRMSLWAPGPAEATTMPRRSPGSTAAPVAGPALSR